MTGPAIRPEHVMTGKTIGCLTVGDRAENTPDGNAQWSCTCGLCGEVSVIAGHRLRDSRSPWKKCPKCRRKP